MCWVSRVPPPGRGSSSTRLRNQWKTPLLELPQHPEPLAFDPLERVLAPGERDDLAELGVAFHAPVRGDPAS